MIFSLYFMFISMLDECKLHSCFKHFLILVYHKRSYNLTIYVQSVVTPIVSTITLVHVRLKSIEISQYRLDFVFQTI